MEMLEAVVKDVEFKGAANGKDYQKFVLESEGNKIVLHNWNKRVDIVKGETVGVEFEPGGKYPGRIIKIEVLKPLTHEEQKTLDKEKTNPEVKHQPHNGNLANSKAYLAMKLASEMVWSDADPKITCANFKALVNQCIILFTEYGEG